MKYVLFTFRVCSIKARKSIGTFPLSDLCLGFDGLDSGLWTLDSGLWTLDSGLWTLLYICSV